MSVNSGQSAAVWPYGSALAPHVARAGTAPLTSATGATSVAARSYPRECDVGEQAGARLALYADVNLNIIDGSAIWLTSLAEALAGWPGLELTVYLKAPEERDLLSRRLHRLPATRLVVPAGPLKINQALDSILKDDQQARYDAVVLRGFHLAQQAADRVTLHQRLWVYLTDIPQTPAQMTDEALAALRRVADASEYLLCQTEELRAWLEAQVPEAIGRCILLPPMIPTPPRVKPIGKVARRRRIAYAGKFAPLWEPLAMIAAFSRARQRYPDLELHVFGDKIHDPPDHPGFAARVRTALEATPGLVWHRGVGREELLAWLAEMDLAWAWRHPTLETQTRELSTKVLEYGAVGLPVILARSAPNERVLGEDYPLFADDAAEATALLLALDDAPEEFTRAAQRAHAASAAFNLDEVRANHLAEPLRLLQGRARIGTEVRRRRQPLNVLVAGHDLKFLRQYTDYLRRIGDVRVRVDTWRWHEDHDEQVSRQLLSTADVIFCEWCLGNAVWYAENKSAQQRLIVRFHHQEQFTVFPARLRMERVDRLVFVSRHQEREVAARFGWKADQLCVVPNAVNVAQFDRPKLPRAFWNLGLLGPCPALKRLDLALDVLEALLECDDRFILYIKGHLPWEYAWLWSRAGEREYFEKQFERLRSSPRLRQHVVFDPPGPDVPAWFQKIGHVLSVSDFESFHLAAAEGAASRAVPWILDRPGAAELFHPDWVCDSTDTLTTRLLRSGPDFAARGAAAREFIRSRYDRACVFEQLNAVVLPFDGQR